MPPRAKRPTPLDVYKAIIDQLATQTVNGVSERLVRQSGVYSKSKGKVSADANKLVSDLTQEQRDMLADLLRDEHVSAIGDALAVLTWWIVCRDVSLSFRGQPMPVELFGMGLEGDYIERYAGRDWPSKGEVRRRSRRS